ncbi:MAG TPA: hypothetical protein VMU33_05765 [Burkholderiaceae bacterium]|nr:hypothetical protein [Burkholderiaceae bacterium]
MRSVDLRTGEALAGSLDAHGAASRSTGALVGLALVAAYLGYQLTATRRQAAGVHAVRDDRRRHDLLCDKLENFVEEVLQTERDLERASLALERLGRNGSGAPVLGGEGSATDLDDGSRSFHAVRALQQLYFPNLEAAVGELSDARQAHLHFLRAETETMASDPERWRISFAGDFAARAAEALQPFAAARYRCVKAARDIVEGELIP